MRNEQTEQRPATRYWSRHQAVIWLAGLIASGSWTVPGFAYTFDTNSDFSLQLNTTIKYSTAVRVSPQASSLKGLLNGDDGNRAFNAGDLTSARFDGLTELIGKYHNVGFDISADGWYDFIYNRRNGNKSPGTFNAFSVPHDQFPAATRDIEGRQVELGNAFGYWNGHLGEMPLNIRAGRYSLLWGESLFAADNGIANGQGPIDIIKAASIPNTQVKELFLPVAQASFTLAVTPKVSFEFYNQFEWRKSRLPAADSYFSEAADLLDAGGERLFVGAPLIPGGPPAAFYRGRDKHPSGLGQFGAAIRYHPSSNLDLGIYALRYNNKVPQVYALPGATFNAAQGRIGDYILGYHNNIELYGVSANTSYGNIDYGAEVSVRRNNDLQANANVLRRGQTADFNRNPLYPVGDSLHYQVNAVWLIPAAFGFDSATALGEIQGSHVMSIYKNAANFSPNARRTTLGIRATYDPALFQVLPGLDIDFPIGLGWNFQGRSGTTAAFNNTNEAYGGDISAGVNFIYNNVWRGGVNYTHFIAGKYVANNGYALAPYGDRDFASFNVLRSF